ncbi:unnamed protein product [Cylindrotheca closterium]|uniref:Uncharacterized protein n=1 Tax=Cylindrotheca closterium TaxID=2856 RepID=A0AAD2G508_9STRA|nr:unnamed protein product [Cylindrotheca closterium]
MVDSRREETDTYIRGVCFAPILLVMGLLVLIFNESHVRTQHKIFRNTIKSVTNVDADSPIKTENDGKLIHLYGWAKVSSTGKVQDPLFGVSKTGIVKLKRYVEMYQWDEEALSSETFEYNKAWENDLIDSTEFEEPDKYSNPTSFPFASGTYYADADDDDEEEQESTKLGNYFLSANVLETMNWFQDYDGTISINTVTDESTKNSLRIYSDEDSGDVDGPSKQYYYTGDDPTSPEVGDARVSFQQIPEQVISVVAMQTSGGGLAPFETAPAKQQQQGKTSTILLVEPGWRSAKQMMTRAHANATLWKGWLRLFAFILIIGGFKIIVEPMSVIADVVEDQFPFFADLVYSASNGAVAYFSGFTFMTVMALSWITYAPLTSLFQLGLVAFSTQIARRMIRSERVPKVTSRATYGFDQFYEMLPMDTSGSNNVV